MSKFKIGDEVVLVKAEDWVKDFGGKIGGIYEIVDFWDDDIGIQSLDGSGHKFYVSDYNIKLHEKPKYQTSNRYKLHKYILSTGFSKLDLSRALSKGDSFLSVETRESQFTNRGDMSDARYKSLRKQIKEIISFEKNLHGKTGSEIFNEICLKNSESFVEDFDKGFDDLKEKTSHKKFEVNINGQVFNFSPNESVSIEIPTKKPSNNGISILALVFFVMLVVFILGCFIYKAA